MDFGFIKDENGVFIGISLGFDFTSEHEWGIKGISSYLGMPKLTRRNMGIKSRTVTSKNVKDYMHFGTSEEYAFLIMTPNIKSQNIRYSLESKVTLNTPWLNYEIKNYKSEIDSRIKCGKDPIITAWSEKDFGIVVKGKNESEWLFELYESFINNEASITYMNITSNVFGNSSLSLLVNKRLSKTLLQQMKDADKENLDLEWIQKKLNLKHRLQKTGKFKDYSLHYCGVKFLNYDASNSKQINCRNENLRVWTNSSDYYGWNTIEEIEELINDKNLTIDEFRSRHK